MPQKRLLYVSIRLLIRFISASFRKSLDKVKKYDVHVVISLRPACQTVAQLRAIYRRKDDKKCTQEHLFDIFLLGNDITCQFWLTVHSTSGDFSLEKLFVWNFSYVWGDTLGILIEISRRYCKSQFLIKAYLLPIVSV